MVLSVQHRNQNLTNVRAALADGDRALAGPDATG